MKERECPCSKPREAGRKVSNRNGNHMQKEETDANTIVVTPLSANNSSVAMVSGGSNKET